MVKGKGNDKEIRRIEEEVDRLTRRKKKIREKRKEMPVSDIKKPDKEYIKPEQNLSSIQKMSVLPKMQKMQNIPISHVTAPEPRIKKRRFFRKTVFRNRIVKPMAVILVISMILTGVQLLSLISTGETVIVPSDFGIPEEFENAKQDFEAESINATQKAEELLGQHDWNYTPFQAGKISYETVNVNKTKPEWPGIFREVAGNISYNIDRKYYVFTYYQGKRVITEGDAGIDPKLAGNILGSLEGNPILKFLIESAMANWRYIWVPIDVDNDDHTDIEVTLNLKGSLKDIQLVDLEDITVTDIIVTLIGGLEIRVNKTGDLSAPLDMYFIKGISYEGKSYVLIFRFYFSPTPQNFCFFMNSDNISGKLRDKTPIEVKPPYTLNWTMSEEITNFDIGVGYAKLDSIITRWADDFSGGSSSEPTTKTWFHDTNEDFSSHMSAESHIDISGGAVKLEKRTGLVPYYTQGIFTSTKLYTDSGLHAVLKSVTWNKYEPTDATKVVVQVRGSDNSIWVPVTDAAPTSLVSGTWFQYKIELTSGGVQTPELDSITLTVTQSDDEGNYRVDTSGGKLRLDTFTFTTSLGSVSIYYPHGTFTSKVWDANGYNILENVNINYDQPTGTSFSLWVRASQDNNTWGQWILANANGVGQSFAKPGGRYFQYKVELSTTRPLVTTGATPQIYSVNLSFSKLVCSKTKYWLGLNLTPGIKNANLYYEETSEKITLNWTGSDKTDVSAFYQEENLYVELELEDLPTRVNLSIESEEPCSTMSYEASSVCSAFSYTSYDFVSGSITHVNISNIPSHIRIIGTFKIPPKEEPNPDPSDSFIGRALNYVIARIGATMQRVRKALTSITETVSTPDNIFHLIPVIPDETISKIEFWSLKGMVENNVIHSERLNLSGNYVGMLNSSIQAGLKNVTELNFSFGRNITLMLKSSGGEDFKAFGLIQDMKGLISIPEMPDAVSIKGTPEEINYSFSAPVELNILANMLTQNYNMDATIKNITSGSFIREDQNISFKFANPVELELSAGKGEFYRMTENYFFVNTSEKTMSLRLSNLTSLYAGKHLGLTLSKEYPLKILLETNITSGKMLIKNLPHSFNASLPESSIVIPGTENLSYTKIYSLFSSTANNILGVAQNINKTVVEEFIGKKIQFSYESSSSPVIVANLTSPDKNMVLWHHGITLKKSDYDLDMKMYLELPEKASFVFNRGKSMELGYQFKNWNASFNWISIALDTENKNVFALLNITKLKSFENGEGIIKMVEEEQVSPGNVTPSTIGELNLSIELFLTSLPQNLNLTVIHDSNLTLSWSVSSSINGVYLNIIREGNNIFYPSHLIIRNTPVKADFTIRTTSEETMIFHVPEISVNTSGKLNFNLKLDGGLVGSKTNFLLYTEGLKSFSLKGYSNTVKINSVGNKLLFRVNNALEGIKEIEILSIGLKHLTLTTNFVFGKLPILEVNCDAKETQINLLPSISTPFGEKNSVALTDLSFLSLNTRKNSIRITDSRTHYITVAPVLSLWM